MIFDIVENLKDYVGMDARLALVDRFLKEHPAESLAVGRYELGDGVYAMVQEPVLKETSMFEAHRRYADVQVIVAGSERIDYAPLGALTGGAGYSGEKDVELFECDPEEGAALRLSAGSFAAFYPKDGHRPGLLWKAGPVKKIVFKIPV